MELPSVSVLAENSCHVESLPPRRESAKRVLLSGMRKPEPILHVPGNTPGERMSNALSMVLKVSKEDLLKEEARLKHGSGTQAGTGT